MIGFFSGLKALRSKTGPGLFALALCPMPLAAQQSDTPWRPVASPEPMTERGARYVSQGMYGTEMLSVRFVKPPNSLPLPFGLFAPGLDTPEALLDAVRNASPSRMAELMLAAECHPDWPFASSPAPRPLSDYNFCDHSLLELRAMLEITLLLDPVEFADTGSQIADITSFALIDSADKRVEMARLRDMDLYISEGGATETSFGTMNFEPSGAFRYASERRQCGRIPDDLQQEDLVRIHFLRQQIADQPETDSFLKSLSGSGPDPREDLARYEARLGVVGEFCVSCYRDFAEIAAGGPGVLCGDGDGQSLIALRLRLPWLTFSSALFDLRAEDGPPVTDWRFQLNVQKQGGASHPYSWRGEGMIEALLNQPQGG